MEMYKVRMWKEYTTNVTQIILYCFFLVVFFCFVIVVVARVYEIVSFIVAIVAVGVDIITLVALIYSVGIMEKCNIAKTSSVKQSQSLCLCPCKL